MRKITINMDDAGERPNQPNITQEQLEYWLYSGIGSYKSRKIQDILNEEKGGGLGISDYRAGLIPAKEVAKPKRVIRVEDLEPGCVLRYLGQPAHHDGWVNVGSEVIVTAVDKYDVVYSGVNKLGTAPSQHCPNSLLVKHFEFVSNPNYAHGLDKRLTYYLKDQEKYSGYYRDKPIKVLKEYKCSYSDEKRIFSDLGCYFPVSDLTTEPPKPTYKVRDGEVTEGDTCYWLGNGGPEKFTVGKPNETWNGNRSNLKDNPWCYQRAEPRILTEFGNPPKARYAYLDTDYDTKQECSGAL